MIIVIKFLVWSIMAGVGAPCLHRREVACFSKGSLVADDQQQESVGLTAPSFHSPVLIGEQMSPPIGCSEEGE
ncbi:hypothetical protein GGR57DRAFT_286037 [Xylariaceae sp. FL1272]|nr:hypothetical protein GGR57DRAFT_286037 [Xylariaceae sp. FL1272]